MCSQWLRLWVYCLMASVLDLIGETPLIEITKFDCGPCQLFLKLESANPSGSIKDRPARFMIEAAENDGRLKPGGTIVEATAGNTGLGLALVGGRKGYRIVLVVPDKMAREKILQCKAMGAEVVLTRSGKDGGFDLELTVTTKSVKSTYLVEVKHWTEQKPGAGHLKKLIEVTARRGATGEARQAHAQARGHGHGRRHDVVQGRLKMVQRRRHVVDG